MFTEIENILGTDLAIEFEYQIDHQTGTGLDWYCKGVISTDIDWYCKGYIDLVINFVLDGSDHYIRLSAFTDYYMAIDDVDINSLHEYIDLNSLEFNFRDSYYSDLPSKVDTDSLYSLMFDLIKKHCSAPPTDLGYVTVTYKLI